MPKKTWNTKHGPLDITFENYWNFSGKSRELLIVNDVVRSQRTTDSTDNLKEAATGSHEVIVDAEGDTYMISAMVGSKWLGLSMGCHIFVNGLLVGGDTRSKLLLSKRNN